MTAQYLHPHHISSTRLRATVAVVLAVHISLLWVAQSELAELPASDESGQVVMADVVSDIPKPSPVSPSKPLPQSTPTPTPSKAVSKADTLAVNQSSQSQESAPAAAAAAAASPSTSTGKAGSPSLVEPSADADYLKNPPPGYPRISRRMGEQGTVVVRVFIGTDGNATQAEIRTSSGYDRLDQTALKTVQAWKYVPGKVNGEAKAMWFNVPLNFVLE